MSIACPGRRRAVALALALLAAAYPAAAAAQDAPTDISIEGPSLDPESPMADIPEIGVAWPDLSADEDVPAEIDQSQQAAIPEGDRRYDVVLDGLGESMGQVGTRFDALSVLREGEGRPANVAQIDRRAREDAELLDTLLRADGYYDATIDLKVEPGTTGRILVRFTIEPGPLYTFEGVDVAGLGATGNKSDSMRETFAVDAADPVDADQVIAGEAALREKLGREGYPFAKVGESEVVIDHDTRTATLKLDVDPGTPRKFGRVNVIGEKPPFGARHVQRIGRFDPGDPYDSAMIDDLRRALIATGIVSVAKVETVPGADPETVDLNVTLEPAPYRTIAGEAGYGTGEGFRVEASWQHRNFIRPEGAVTVRGVLGTKEQLVGVTLRQGNFRKRDQILTARVLASDTQLDAFEARTFEIGAGIERQTSLIFQRKWTWSAGIELIASDERDSTARIAGERRKTFFVGALPGTLNYDGTDDLLNPTRGFRLGGRLSPEISLQSGTFGYARARIDASAYFPVADDRVVVAGRVRVGSILGARVQSIAPSRRFYAGGGGSVRGFGYQRIGPLDFFGDPTGGRSLAEFSLEARVKLPDFGIGDTGLVPFVDAGNIYSKPYPDFSGMRYGAGLGFRYYTSFGPIRVDLATPLNPRRGDPKVAVYVSLGQAF